MEGSYRTHHVSDWGSSTFSKHGRVARCSVQKTPTTTFSNSHAASIIIFLLVWHELADLSRP